MRRYQRILGVIASACWFIALSINVLSAFEFDVSELRTPQLAIAILALLFTVLYVAAQVDAARDL